MMLDEVRGGRMSRLASWFFQNSAIQYLGKISYSIYLGHLVVFMMLQGFFYIWFPQMDGKLRFYLILALTLVGTVVLAHALYLVVEKRGVELGKRVVDSMQAGRKKRSRDLGSES